MGIYFFEYPEQINSDGIAYILLAKHYVLGHFELGASSYWGPLLPWTIAVAIKAGFTSLNAAHLAMTFSGLVFFAGSCRLLSRFPLQKMEYNFSVFALFICGLVWSGRSITPDLLENGLVAASIAPFFERRWPSAPKTLAISSLLLGAAFLAKPVALPFGVMVIGLRAIGAFVFEGSRPAALVPSLAILAGFGSLLVVPWVSTLSLLAHHFVWSDAGWINFAKSGPYYALDAAGQIRDEHATFMQFHQPRPGRWSSWENPPEMAYVKWSPLHSAAEFGYYIKLIFQSLTGIARDLASIDIFGFGLSMTLINFFIFLKGRKYSELDYWRLSIIPISVLTMLYVPFVYWGDLRYFWISAPLMVGGAMMVARTSIADRPQQGLTQFALSALISLSFVLPCVPELSRAVTRNFSAEQANLGPANDYAKFLIPKKLTGPVAGAGYTVGVHAFELAFAMNTTFGGAMVDPNVDDLIQARSQLFLTPRGNDLDRRLSADPRFERIDPPGLRRWDAVVLYLKLVQT
jgi:hypothetical protein